MSKPVLIDTPHWGRTARQAPTTQRLTSDINVDFVVVGGGLTGTRTALGLAESGASVALLEAKTIGWGASGRSGGQCNPMWRATPETLRNRLGTIAADRLIQKTLSSAHDLFADIERYGIECDAVQNGWVQAAHCPSAQKNMQQLAESWNAVGADIRVLSSTEVEQISGSPAYGFALFHKNGGHVHPLSMTRGFARAAQNFGVLLYENAPVQSLTREKNVWRLSTPTGTVSAPKVILTTNAYTDDLWPGLKQSFYPMVSISLATAPLSTTQQKSVLPKSVTISDSRRAIYYARYDRDYRLIFGCVGSNDSVKTLGGIARVQRGLQTVFPQIADIDIEAYWAGRIAVTPDMMPRLHAPADGILAGLGFSGRGIAMTSVMARSLVHKALGGQDNNIAFPVSEITAAPMQRTIRRLIPLAAPAMSLRDSWDGVLHRK